MSTTLGNTSPRNGDQYNYRVVPEVPPIANPAPLGLAAFGITTFVLSVYNTGLGYGWQQRSNVVVGMAVFYGGLAQLLAGMWAFKAGETFPATVFSSYGAFWLSFATIFIPSFGVIDAFIDKDTGVLAADELNTMLGVYLLSWTFLTFVFFLCTLRRNVASIVLFGLLTLTFLVLAIGKLSRENAKMGQIAGGYLGIVTAVVAIYLALANLATREDTFFTLPVGQFVPTESPQKKRTDDFEI